MMATYMQGSLGDENGYIIITGGCDDPLGNQRDPAVSMNLFFCTSVTSSTFKFDPFQSTITEMAQAPHARYRHAAAVANGKLFVFGGRDVNDTLVHAIDVRHLRCMGNSSCFDCYNTRLCLSFTIS